MPDDLVMTKHGKRRHRTLNWTDLDKEGRRLEGIIKQMNTKFHKTNDPKLQLAYIDAFLKATNAKFKLIRDCIDTS